MFLAEKIYKIQKELEEKRLRRMQEKSGGTAAIGGGGGGASDQSSILVSGSLRFRLFWAVTSGGADPDDSLSGGSVSSVALI